LKNTETDSMKKMIALSAVAVVLLSSCAEHINGNGVIEERTHEVKAFDQIDIAGTFEIHLFQGKPSLEIIADENLHEHIKVQNENGELKISTEGKYLDSDDLILRISSKSIEEIELAGATELISKDKIRTESLEIELAGASSAELEVNAEDLEIDISGGAEVVLEGKVENLQIDISGAGEIMALDLVSANADVDVAGAGEIELTVKKKLDVSIAGAGEVRYKGDPEISQSIAGAGEIEKISD